MICNSALVLQQVLPAKECQHEGLGKHKWFHIPMLPGYAITLGKWTCAPLSRTKHLRGFKSLWYPAELPAGYNNFLLLWLCHLSSLVCTYYYNHSGFKHYSEIGFYLNLEGKWSAANLRCWATSWWTARITKLISFPFGPAILQMSIFQFHHLVQFPKFLTRWISRPSRSWGQWLCVHHLTTHLCCDHDVSVQCIQGIQVHEHKAAWWAKMLVLYTLASTDNSAMESSSAVTEWLTLAAW